MSHRVRDQRDSWPGSSARKNRLRSRRRRTSGASHRRAVDEVRVCRAIIWKKDLEANWHVCPKCQHHFRLSARQRLELLLDGRWTEHDAGLASNDPLQFTDTKPYAARLHDAQTQARHEGRDSDRRGNARRAAGDLLLDGVWVYRRIDGRGGGRKSDARRSSGRSSGRCRW